MGNTSVNTACNPRFLRLDCGISACKNSLYELVCNSMRFGGAMISLILPKLIRSAIARDGMFTFSQWTDLRRSVHFQLNDTRQERCRFATNLPKLKSPQAISMCSHL